MPLPAKRVDTVRVPNDTTTYNIVPSSLQDGSGKHSIATPTTTKDTTLVVGVKINNVTKEPTNGIVDLGTFQDGLDGDQLAAVNSGITADKVTKYEGYETKINSNTSEIGTIKDVLKSGVTFKGKITDPTLPAATDYNNGDLIIFGEKEYICFDNGTSKEWIELGDEGTHLTKAMADTYYVPYSGATKDVNLGEHSATVKNIVANGTTKLCGGFEPIKSYTVNADYRGRQTTLVLNVFTENYVESSKMYSFFGSASATALGAGEFICNGSYKLDTNGNLDGAVLLTTMKRDIGSLIMVGQYENGQLITVNLVGYDAIEFVQDWANGTFAKLGNPNNFTGSSNVFNGSLIANGTLKLEGGFEPIKTYTVDGTYQEKPLSVTLDIFTEKRGVVDSASNPPITTYSFYGSANAPALGGEIIGQGVYFLNTNNNQIYSLLFVCGLNTYYLDGDTGEFKFDTIPQGTDVDNYVENYVKNTLDGMISKDSSGKIAVGRGIIVEADGNVAVKKSLEVSETTKLLGGLEPVATYLDTYKSDNDVRVYDFGILNKDKTEYGTDNAHLLVFVSRPLSEEGAKRSLSLVGFGKLDVSPQKIINYVEMAGNDITGTQTFVSLIYRPSDEIFSIKTVEGALTEIKGDIPNNIKDGTGVNSIQENQDGTGGKFDFSGKNPNAFSFDATLNGELDYGALGAFSSSFGGKGQARGKRSFQVGTTTIAYGNYTFASGSDSVAMGPASHVEGYSNTTGPTADSSHAEGGENLVTSNRGHVEGYKNTVKGMNGHGEGENVLVTENAEAGHAEGTNTKSNNTSAHAEGQQTEANGKNSHSENTLTKANGDSSHAEGYGNEVNSYAGHIEGSGNKILNTLPSSGGGDTPGLSPTDPDDPSFNINEHLGYNSHVEGSLNISYGYNSHTEGTKNTTFGHYAHTEGSGNKNYGTNNHMEGSQNKMSDTAAVAITDSHIEGTNNNVTNSCSNLHMGGVSNTGGADGAYVMGHDNDVSSTARYSATFGKGLKTTDEDTIVLGTYNKVQQGTGRMLVIGNGTSDTARKNAVEIMRDGRVKLFKAPEEDNDAVRLWELHSKQDVIYGAQAQALDSTITKAKVDKYESYETKINSNTTEINTLKGKPGLDKVGTVTGITMNGTSKTVGSDGKVDLGKVITDTADLVPYTGATKNINLGGHRITTARKTLTDNDTQVQLTPDWISLINPGYGVSISADSIRVKDRVLEWPSAEGQRDTFATIGDITTKVSGFVPYEGATKDINIGNHGILMGEPTGTLLTLDPGTIMFSLGGENQDLLYIDARTVTISNDNAGDTIYWPGAIGSTTPGAKVFALTSDITSHAGIDKVGTVTSVNGTSPDSNGNVNISIPGASDWKFLKKVAEKSFEKLFTEVKPGSSGIPTGYANVSVVITTYANTFSDGGYKTVMDITCRCPQFNLNDVGFKVLLSTVGSRWFVPRMAIGKGDMGSTAFNVMMDKLNTQKDAVGISVEEVAVFKDNRGVSGNPGTLNVSGVTSAQVVYDASEFRAFAVMLELDKDNEGKAIPCTGVHYKINIFHPHPIF